MRSIEYTYMHDPMPARLPLSRAAVIARLILFRHGRREAGFGGARTGRENFGVHREGVELLAYHHEAGFGWRSPRCFGIPFGF